MKTHIFDKVVMFIVALFLGVLGIYLACISTNILPYQQISEVMTWVSANWLQMLAGVAVGLILFAVGIKMMIIVFAREEKHSRYSTVAKTQLGDVIIATDTIKQVVQRSIADHPQIINSAIFIATQPEAVAISIKVALKLDEINIPEVTAGIQETVRSTVTDTTGIAVSAVRINVDNTVASHG